MRTTIRQLDGYKHGTYSYSPMTARGLAAARRKVLAAAKEGPYGAYCLRNDSITYIRDASGVSRVECGPDGRRLSERIVWHAE